MYPIRTGKEFLERGYEVFGLCSASTQVAEGMRDAGIETFEVSSKGHLIAFQLLRLNQWLKQRNVEIIHCHKSGDLLVSSLLSLFTKRKTFFTEHMGVTRPKKDLYHHWVYSHIEKVLSISDATYRRNIKALPTSASRIQRLWLGTDIKPPINDTQRIKLEKNSLEIPRENLVIGTVGRICDGKGQLELIRAFAQLSCKHSNIHLLIVGGLNEQEGADTNYISVLRETIDNLGLEDRVTFTGFRSDIDVMFAMMDIVCLPYRNEAFGLTAIEAMAARKAIVASNTGALPEILEETALLSDPSNIESISANLLTLINDKPLRNQLAKAARVRAVQNFSSQSHIQSLISVYYA